jgi:uncharacterized membrane protein
MNYKTFRLVQGFIALILGGTFAVSILLENWIVPLVAIAAAILVEIIIRRRMKEIINDERTYTIAGKASRLTLQIGTLAMGLTGIIMFIISHDTSRAMGWSAITLCDATCGLIIIHGLANIYYRVKLGGRNE